MEANRRQQSVALTGSATRAGDSRRAIQAVLGGLSWIGFALLWMWQLEVYVPSTWLYSICLIATILAAWIVFTICWVRWNRNIYARRHRRTSPVRQEVSFDQDTLGRPIKAPGGIRAAEGQIIVSVDDDGNKRYESARRQWFPRVPSVQELLPDWNAIPVNGNGNGNGHGHVPAPVNGTGQRNGHVTVDIDGYPAAAAIPQANGSDIGYRIPSDALHGHAPNGDIDRYPAAVNGNGNGHHPAPVNGNGHGSDLAEVRRRLAGIRDRCEELVR